MLDEARREDPKIISLMHHGYKFETMAPMSDEGLQELLDEKVMDLRKKMGKKNKETQKFLEYLRLHDFSEKQLSHMKFEELETAYKTTIEAVKKDEWERMKKKSTDQKNKLEKIYKIFGEKCKFLVDHGMAV